MGELVNTAGYLVSYHLIAIIIQDAAISVDWIVVATAPNRVGLAMLGASQVAI